MNIMQVTQTAYEDATNDDEEDGDDDVDNSSTRKLKNKLCNNRKSHSFNKEI